MSAKLKQEGNVVEGTPERKASEAERLIKKVSSYRLTKLFIRRKKIQELSRWKTQLFDEGFVGGWITILEKQDIELTHHSRKTNLNLDGLIMRTKHPIRRENALVQIFQWKDCSSFMPQQTSHWIPLRVLIWIHKQFGNWSENHNQTLAFDDLSLHNEIFNWKT